MQLLNIVEILGPPRLALELDEIRNTGHRDRARAKLSPRGPRKSLVDAKRFLDEDIDLGCRVFRAPKSEYDQALLVDPFTTFRWIGELQRGHRCARAVAE